jgi:hypothetical protein
VTAYSVVAVRNGAVAAWKNVGPDFRSAFVGLTNGLTYDVTVLAWNRLGPIAGGASLPLTPSQSAPALRLSSPPQGAEVLWGGPKPIVRWSGVADSGGAPVEGWSVVVQSSSAGTVWYHAGPQARSYAITAGKAGQACTARVIAWTAAGATASDPLQCS